MRCAWISFIGAAALIALAVPNAFAAEQAFQIPTRAGVTESFLFESPDHPSASVILLPGGNGVIGLSISDDSYKLKSGGNFLVRTRHNEVAAGLVAVTVDVPSDKSDGISPRFRMDAEHAQDIEAIINWLKQRVSAPVWLVGTSQGTVSAAALAVRLGSKIDGVVLTSSVVVEKGNGPDANGVLSIDLEKIAVPVMVMNHVEDSCVASPPANAPEIMAKLKASPRTELKSIEGSLPPKSGPCDPFAPHGYYGAEQPAIAAMTAFILRK